jgi:hypothetical protein
VPPGRAASLAAAEGILLFCIDSGTEKASRVTGVTVATVMLRGLVAPYLAIY